MAVPHIESSSSSSTFVSNVFSLRSRATLPSTIISRSITNQPNNPPADPTPNTTASFSSNSAFTDSTQIQYGYCMTCDSKVKWPKGIQVFRCMACLTINDLDPLPSPRFHSSFSSSPPNHLNNSGPLPGSSSLNSTTSSSTSSRDPLSYSSRPKFLPASLDRTHSLITKSIEAYLRHQNHVFIELLTTSLPSSQQPKSISSTDPAVLSYLPSSPDNPTIASYSSPERTASELSFSSSPLYTSPTLNSHQSTLDSNNADLTLLNQPTSVSIPVKPHVQSVNCQSIISPLDIHTSPSSFSNSPDGTLPAPTNFSQCPSNNRPPRATNLSSASRSPRLVPVPESSSHSFAAITSTLSQLPTASAPIPPRPNDTCDDHRRPSLSKPIFKPVEDYIMNIFSTWESINSSFCTAKPHPNALRNRSDGPAPSTTTSKTPSANSNVSSTATSNPQASQISLKSVSPSATTSAATTISSSIPIVNNPSQLKSRAPPNTPPSFPPDVPALDAKTLLLGDVAENGIWWTGPMERETIRGRISRHDSANYLSWVANHRSPYIDWSDLNLWYDMILSAGSTWRAVANQHFPNLLRDFQSSPDGISLIDKIENDLESSRLHLQKTLLKATESILRRPGRPLIDTFQVRFIFIIMSNPLFHTSTARRYASPLIPSHSSPLSHQPAHPSSAHRNVSMPSRRGPLNFSFLSYLPAVKTRRRSRSFGEREHSIETSNQSYHSGLIKRILGLLANLPDECHRPLVAWFTKLPVDLFCRIVDMVASFVTYRLTHSGDRKISKPSGIQVQNPDVTAGLIPQLATNSGNTSAQLYAALGLSNAAGTGLSAGAHGSMQIERKKVDDNFTFTPPPYADDWQLRAAARVMALLFAANSVFFTKHRRPSSSTTTSSPAAYYAQKYGNFNFHSAGNPNLNRASIFDDLNNLFSDMTLASCSAANFDEPVSSARTKAPGQLLPTSYFYNTLLDYSGYLIADFETWESRRFGSRLFAFCQYPFFLSIGAKIRILEHDARRQMENKAREAFFDSLLKNRAVEQYFNMRVRRDCLVEDSLARISESVGAGGLGMDDVKKSLRVQFVGEDGIDAGGLKKEWFLLLVRELFDPSNGMFLYDEESYYCYFNPFSFEQGEQYCLVGAVLGLAIYNLTILDVALPPFAFRKLLAAAPTPNVSSLSGEHHHHRHNQQHHGKIGHPPPHFNPTLDDLAELHPTLARSLRQLLKYQPPQDDLSSKTTHPQYRATGFAEFDELVDTEFSGRRGEVKHQQNSLVREDYEQDYHDDVSPVMNGKVDVNNVMTRSYCSSEQSSEIDDPFWLTFGLYFTASLDRYGTTHVVELCPDGENVPVTMANRAEYVNAYVRYILVDSVSRQFEPFKRGFWSVCAGNAIGLFRADEVELLVRGAEEGLDVTTLQAVAVYEGYTDPATGKPLPSAKVPETVPSVQWFWEMLKMASKKDRAKIIGFITGSDRVPAVGASSLVIRIVYGGEVGMNQYKGHHFFLAPGAAEKSIRLPVARTCFNMLILPAYRTRRELFERLWKAVTESSGFGLK